MRAFRSSSRRVQSARAVAEAGFDRYYLAAAALSASLLLAGALGAQNPTPVQTPEPSSITVTGRGESMATPDQARVVFLVETRAANATEAARENARIQDQVIRALRGAGIETRDISTSGYSLHPDQQYDERERRSRVVGYIARNGVEVRVREIAQVGPLIDAAISAGANGVGNLSFESSRAVELRREALAGAVANACQDAEVIARAAGGSLGRLLEISSANYNDQPPRPMYRTMAAGMAEDASTPIEPGELSTAAMVSARWEFLPALSSDSRCD